MSRLQFFKYAVGELESHEPKQIDLGYIGYFKKKLKQIIMSAIIFGLVIQVLTSQIEKFRTEKSQSQQFEKYSTFSYVFSDKSIPFHYFEMYKEVDILERIDCNTRTEHSENSKKHCEKIECLKKNSIEIRNECLF